jgi:hypothetical protein
MKDIIYILSRGFILLAILVFAGYFMSFIIVHFVSSLIDVFLKVSNGSFSELVIMDFLMLILFVLIIIGFYKYSKNTKK